MMNRHRPRNKKHNKTIETCVIVRADECRGDAEKMVRKFCKKVKRSGIIDEFRERTTYKKPSLKRREQKAARKRIIDKVNKKRTELFNFSAGRSTRR